jgi:hypothetical protein
MGMGISIESHAYNITPLITGFRVGIFPEKQEDTNGTESFEGAVARAG